MKITSKIFIMLILIVFIASISGVYGAWIFAEDNVFEDDKNVMITLSEFTWAPEEILPTTQPGKNYLDLLDSILNNLKGGLNSSKDTLENAVLKHKLVHSSQNVTGGNLKHLFITEESKELDFMVEYINNNEFHVYMYEHYDTINGLVGVTNIVIYKTILVYENKEWIGLESQVGYATLKYFNNSSEVAIDPSSWVLGNISKN